MWRACQAAAQRSVSGPPCVHASAADPPPSPPVPPAASVSLGQPREFLLRRIADHSDKYRFRLGNGALLVMQGSVQEGWLHSVPRRQGLQGERISLTFRRVVLPERAVARQ